MSMEELFNRFLSEKYEKEEVMTSDVMSAAKKERIITYLKGGFPETTPNFRYMVKRKGYTLESSDRVTQLIIPKTTKIKGESYTNDREVASMDEFFGVLEQVHKDINHGGLLKTYDAVAAKFAGIPRCVVKEYIELCDVCKAKKKQIKAPNTPNGCTTLTKRPLQRSQIDLIDKTMEPDGAYHYIGHFLDHVSRINVLFPLKTNTARDVVPMLRARVLAYFGLPSILHTDNCPDLGARGLKELVLGWPGRTSIIRGRPNQPQVLQLSDNARKKVEEILGAMTASFRKKNPDVSVPWAAMLPKVQCESCFIRAGRPVFEMLACLSDQLNTYFNKALHQSPYEGLFGFPPPEQGLGSSAVIEEASWEGVIEEDCLPVNQAVSHEQSSSNNSFHRGQDDTLRTQGLCEEGRQSTVCVRKMDSSLGDSPARAHNNSQDSEPGNNTASIDQSVCHHQPPPHFCYPINPHQHPYLH